MEKKILAVLKRARRVLVTMHVHPDPDALGGALAMTLYLRSLGKEVRLVNEDACPSWLSFMPRTALCRKFTGKERFRPDLAVVLDCGDFERVGKVGALIGDAPVVNIDHHITNRKFGTYALVRPECSSTSEILYGLLRGANAAITRDMAVLLYLGIVTDTGSFGFDGTTQHTHRVAAELLAHGLPVAELHRQVYETLPREDLKGFLATMNRLELVADGRAAFLELTLRDVAAFSKDFDLRDRVFGFLRAVRGLDVIVIFTETDSGRVRVNFRSRGRINVAALAGRFGGGGHRNASGCHITGTLAHARREINAALPEVW